MSLVLWCELLWGCSRHINQPLTAPEGGAVSTEGVGGVRDVRVPWAYPYRCAYVGLDAGGGVVIGREKGLESSWRSAGRGGFDGVASAATTSGQRVPLILSDEGRRPPLTLGLDCEDPESAHPQVLRWTPIPASLPWGGYLLNPDSLIAVARCLNPSGGLCMHRLGGGGEARVPLVVPTERNRYDSYRLAVLANTAHSVVVIDDVDGVETLMEIGPAGTASPLRPLDSQRFAPELMQEAGVCQIAILPAYAGPSSDTPYMARCSISTQVGDLFGGQASTSFGWLHLSDQGEIEPQEVWRGEGGDLGELPGGLGGGGGNENRLCGFAVEVDASRYASDADRMVALYDVFDSSVRAVRGDTASWLVRADGCGELAATCLQADGVGPIRVTTVEGPVGMRIQGSDLIVLDAYRTRRIRCGD